MAEVERVNVVRPATPVGRKLDPQSRLSVEQAQGAFEHFLLKEEAEPEKKPRKPKAEAKPTAPEPEPAPAPEPEPEPEAEPEPESPKETQVEAEAAPTEGEPLEEGEPEEEQPKRRFRIPETEEEVDEDDLVRGYMRGRDYTQKRMEDSKRERERDARLQAIESERKIERQQYAERISALERTIQEATPVEPNWVERQKVVSAEQFAADFAQWQDFKRYKTDVERQAAEARARVAADRQAEFEAYKTSEAKKLLDKIPEWKNPEVAERERRILWDYAMNTLEYTEDQLNAVTDHRAVVALRKAYEADKSRSRLPAVRAKLQEIKTASPGPASQARRNVTEVDRRRAQLKKTGHVKDAGRLIESILGD